MRIWTSRLAGLAVILLCITGVIQAQDPVFSQYTASPVYTNPALAGLFDGEVRLTANYRDQWSSVLGADPLQTYAASGELRYNVGGRDYLAVAVNMLHDQGGESQFNITRAGFGVTMQKYLDGGRGRDATYLGFGARVGYGQHSFDPANLWFSSGIDTATLVIEQSARALPAGFTTSTRGYLDMAGGINLAVVRREYSLTVGVAAHHLNQPNVSFLFNSEELLKPRFTALVGGEYLIEDNLRLMPSAIYEKKGEVSRITAGSAIYYQPERGGDAGFRVGMYARTANQFETGVYVQSLIVSGQVEFKRMTVGMSYDINTGQVGRATDGRGAFELSLSWTKEGKSRYKVVCPKL